MNRGGVETWLMHVLRRVDRTEVVLDFLVHRESRGAFDDEIEALGATIWRCPAPHRPIGFAKRLRATLREHGPYNILHSHVHHYSGWVLAQAAACGVPVRIAHSHNDTTLSDSNAHLIRRAYLALSTRLIGRYATGGLACTADAARSLFGPSWKADHRWEVLHYGVDLTQFRGAVDANSIRAELGISPGAPVVGHVGRFHAQKNHSFIVEIVKEVASRLPSVRFLLVGDGPLRADIRASVVQAGVSNFVVFAGLRDDVPRLMRGAMDLLLMPSLFEGLPVAAIEAQAAGLPLLLSEEVSREVDVVPENVIRISLSASAAVWAEIVCQEIRSGARKTRGEALQEMAASALNIEVSAKRLVDYYFRESGVDSAR